MMALFHGYMEAYGSYDKLEERSGSLKKEIKRSARTVRKTVTDHVWMDHLKGVSPVGLIPIDQNNECVWGCVDIDVYADINHAYLAELCDKHDFPAVICRSKSGGAHVFLFTEKPVPAVDMRQKLSELAVVLGAGGSEIFPKQNEVLYDRGDLGHWLNMPYYDAERTTRFCITVEGRQLALQEFLDYAEKRRVKLDDFLDLGKPIQTDPIEDIDDGPPCLKVLASRGFPEGSRNNGLFALGVLAKRKFPDTWESVLEDWNRRFMDPPLDVGEINGVVRSLTKKDYEYRCKDQPLASYCDSKTCRKQKFGVGGGALHPVITGLSIMMCEPRLFFVNLSDGGTVECTSPQLLNPRLFQQCALDQQMVVLPLIKYEDWMSQINKCMENATKIEAPPEVGTTGIFMELLERFCTDKHRAATPEEMLLGKPWLNESEGRYYFRLRDLMEYLDRMKFKDLTRPQITNRIKKYRGDTAFMNLNGRGTNVWYIPEKQFKVQTMPHKITQIQEVPI